MFGRVFSMTGVAGLARAARMCRGILPALLLAAPLAGYPQSYLDAIQVEAEKLDGGSAGDSEAAPAASGAADDQHRAGFEEELQGRYSGTYLFYKKLPAKSQEEVYLDYQQGASIEEVRKTIMNRFLHSR
jgi:hypothetical protein